MRGSPAGPFPAALTLRRRHRPHRPGPATWRDSPAAPGTGLIPRLGGSSLGVSGPRGAPPLRRALRGWAFPPCAPAPVQLGAAAPGTRALAALRAGPPWLRRRREPSSRSHVQSSRSNEAKTSWVLRGRRQPAFLRAAPEVPG